MNFKDFFGKKFTFALVTFGVVTICFCINARFTSSDYKEIVLGLGLGFLVSQAYVDSKKPEGGS